MMLHWKAEHCFCINKNTKNVSINILHFSIKKRRGALFGLYTVAIYCIFTKWRIGEGDLATCYEPASPFLVLQKVIRPFRPFVSTNVPSFDQGKLSGCSSGYAWR